MFVTIDIQLGTNCDGSDETAMYNTKWHPSSLVCINHPLSEQVLVVTTFMTL